MSLAGKATVPITHEDNVIIFMGDMPLDPLAMTSFACLCFAQQSSALAVLAVAK